MKKRLTSILLAITMCLSMAIPVLAANSDPIGFYENGMVEVKVSGLEPSKKFNMISVVDTTAGKNLGLGDGEVDTDGNLSAVIPTGRIEESNLSNCYVYVYSNGTGAVVVSGPLALKRYTITLNLDGGTLPTGTDNPLTCETGKTVVLPTPSKDGFTFQGWYDGTNSVASPYSATADVTLTAHWGTASAKPQYTITASAASGGNITPATATVQQGGSTTFTVTPNSNYTINTVTVAPQSAATLSRSGNTITLSNVQGNCTLSVTFNYNGSGGGGSGGSSGGGGGGGGGGGSSSNVTITRPTNGTVTFRPSNPSKGETVTLTVKPKAGYELSKLTVTDKEGNEIELTDIGDNKFTFTMPSGKVSVKAEFKPEGSTTPEKHPFTDVPAGSWYANAVQYMYEKGMMTGVTPTTFVPTQIVDRATIVTMLHRLEGTPAGGTASFPDVAPGQWYSKAVAWAASNNVVLGYENGKFGPSDTITREQMAVILYRYAQHNQ